MLDVVDRYGSGNEASHVAYEHARCSFAQERMWFAEQLLPGRAVYLVGSTLQIQGPFAPALFEEAINVIICRHEVLRTVFIEQDGQPRQIIFDSARIRIEFSDLCGCSEDECNVEVRRTINETRGPFNLSRVPLLRVRLIRTAEETHIVIVVLHHIIGDGWSLNILLHEVSIAYTALVSGHLPVFAELPVQYADYAEWEREYLQGETLEQQLSYWREQLRNMPPLLNLPYDFPRPPVFTFRGAADRMHISNDLLEGAKRLARQRGCTLFAVLLSAFYSLLFRYTGMADIAVATPSAGRSHPEVEGLIGLFVNTLVLRVQIARAESFFSMLAKVQRLLLDAYANQEVSFERVVEEINPRRDLTANPLAQVMISFENTPVRDPNSGGLVLAPTPIGTETTIAQFDWQLDFQNYGNTFGGSWVFNTDLFCRESIRRTICHFQILFGAALAAPEKPISDLPLLLEAEWKQVVEEWNETAAEYPARCMHELFEQQAEQTPDSTAVVYADQQLSYRELDRRASDLAGHLRALGVKPEMRVGICVERSLETVIGFLGVLKAGGAYVPLDPGYPDERLRYMLKDAEVAVLLSEKEVLEQRILGADVKVVMLDSASGVIGRSEQMRRREVDPGNLAYVIYTSGSTGQPKGVMVSHRNLVPLVRNTNYIQLNAENVMAQVSNISFDTAAFEIWGALLNGARLVIINNNELLYPRQFKQKLEEHHVNTMWLTVGVFNQYADELGDGLSKLQYLLVGGDALDPGVIARVLSSHAPQHLINGYGPTETTTFAATYEISAVDGNMRSIPIGRPIANTRIYILDAFGMPAPVGVTGELHIGGEGVARGYLNRPELTAERFLPDPFATHPHARMYGTGDLARWLANGTIEFLGRNDCQVKVRGFRIELGEIEIRLGEHAGVQEAVVVLRGEGPEQQLVAYLVSREGKEIRSEELRRHLRERLPEYMLPSVFVVVEKIPLTPNGKVDRKTLLGLTLQTAEGLEQPRNATEEILCGIFAEVLKLDHVGIEQNFFEIGGHSLLATQVMSRLRNIFGRELPLQTLFEAPAIVDLARKVQWAGTSEQIIAPPLAPYVQKDDPPLSYAQQRLWFLDQMAPGTAAYNIPFAVRLSGDLNRQCLERSMKEVVRRHQVLRTSIGVKGGMPIQVISPEPLLRMEDFDLRGLEAGERDTEARRLAREEATRPFDLERSPLLRIKLLRLDEEDHVLLVTMHHLVSDGWSVGIIVREFSELYSAYLQEREPHLPELKIQYADYALWQREWLQGAVLEGQLMYWRKQLSGLEPLQLPTDHARPSVMSWRGASVSFSITTEQSRKLKEAGRRHGTTLFMSLLAAFKVVLGKYAGQHDVVVGTSVANRTRLEIESLIGFFVNALVLRTDLSGDPSFADVMTRVRQVTLGAYEHQDVPFEKVVEDLQPERDLHRSPLFQVMLVLQNTERQELQMPGLSLSGFGVESQVAPFDLLLTVGERPDGLAGEINYSSVLYEADTMKRLVEHMRAALEQMVEDPRRKIGTVSLLSEEERQQVIRLWNQTEGQPPRQCVHELFEAQVERAPHSIALVHEGMSLTYTELNRRANRLARYLRAMGVAPEVRVAICLDRSFEMIVAILGVLKAGAAYVPLDPSYPKERLRYMLADSRPIAIITQAHIKEWFEGIDQLLPVLDIAIAHEWPYESSNNLQPGEIEVTPQNSAYVIYTSGSTGEPKGVMIEHANITRLFSTTHSWFQFDSNDAWTLFHSYAFDFSVWEIWGALLYGGRLIIVRKDTVRSPEEFYRLVCRERVTILNQTPSAFRQLIAAQNNNDGRHQLRHVIFGGEALDVAMLEPWYEQNRSVSTQLINMYGITETTVHVTYRRIQQADTAWRGSPIGCRIPDLRIYILDALQQPTAIGLIGELYIGGAGLARGYLNRPELTAERFLPDPFDQEPGARMYKTGDLGKWRPDGTIEFQGRNDSQVKIRGFRIELGEIEARLAQHEEIHDTIVIAQEGAEKEKRLVAYYTAAKKEGQSASDREIGNLSADKLRQYMMDQMPEHMVPAAYVRLEAFPLTANGKLDRKALPEPGSDAYGVSQYEAPAGEIETVLAGIWKDMLGVQQVGRHDNYFALGGDSIRVIELISKAREYGWPLTPQQVFRHQTIAGLTGEILAGFDDNQARFEETSVTLLSHADRSLLPAEVEDAYSLSALQMGMLFHNQFMPELGTYHDVFSYHVRLVHGWDLETFVAVLNALAGKHPILRTSISLDHFSEPLQLVHREAAVPVTVCDITEFPAAVQDEMIAAWMKQENKRSFDLDKPPLLHIFIHLRSLDTLQYTLSFHHAILDGWSVAAFQTELFEEYARLRMQGGKKPTLKPLAANFKMAVAAEKRCQQSEQAKSFWKSYLEDHSISSLPPLEIGEEQDHAVSFAEVIPAKLRNGLAELASSLHVPMKSVLLTAHLRVISILSGSHDVVTGMVTHGRPHVTDGERILGLFLNTLPFRLDLVSCTWGELIQAAFASELKIVPYRNYPYFQFFQENNRVPIFETVFNYVDFHVYDRLREAGGVEVLGGVVFERTNFALTTNFIQQQDQMQLVFHFDSNRLSISQIQVIAGYYLSVLHSMINAVENFHDQCDCLPERERHQVLYSWNGAQISYPPNHLHEMIEEKAVQMPDSIALVYEKQELTYQQLNERANQMAHYLIGLGIGPEARVGICLERGIEMVVAMVGVLKSGGAYVPLDPDYPEERLEYVLADADVQVLVTQKDMASRMVASRAVKVGVDLDREKIDRCGVHNPDRTIHHENAAYVIYTSGSTGHPKGVMVSQSALTNFLRSMQQVDILRTPCSLLAVTTISFDIAALELYLPLVTGGKVIIATRQMVNDGARLREVLEEMKINAMQATPATWRLLLDAGWNGPITVLCGGEALDWNLANHLMVGAGPSGTTINLYGPTEATIWCASRYLIGNERQSTAFVPVGRPIHNMRMYVLQMGMQPAPVGATGELYIAGTGLARGYLKRPDLTADRFCPDPFGVVGGERLYRTGDLGRWLSNGDLEFLGRVDHQVKIRGFRIELGEIEAALLERDGVKQAVVVVREDEPGLKQLVAYIVSREGSASSPEELSSHLQRRLPDYMVPAIFVILDQLPLTANGKVDRQVLPVPEGRSKDKQYLPPRTEIEQILCGAFAEILRIERVGREDDFFGLGGHSLVATQLIARVRQAFDIDLPLRVLFETPRIADLGTWIKKERLGEGLPKFHSISRSDQYLPLSYAQKRLWFIHYLDADSSAYNIPFALRLQGALNKPSLRQSFYAVTERHEVLRSSFPTRRGRPVQVISLRPDLQFEEIDLSALGPGNAESEVGRLAKVEARTPFELEQGPLLRVKLLQLREDESILLVTLHHIIWDVWSQQVMVRELVALYDAFCDNKPSPLKPLPMQYADYAIWQKQWIKERLPAQMNYWKTKLANFRPTRLPVSSDANGNGASHPATEGLSFSEDQSAKLRAICRCANVTPFMLFLAGLKILLSYHTKTVDIIVGANVANRSLVETEELIGFFVNQLVLRTDLSGNPEFGEILCRVRSTVVDGYDHQDLPFEKIVGAIISKRSTDHSSLFHIRFDYVENVTEMKVSNLKVSSLPLNADPLHDDLHIIASNMGRHFSIQVVYNTRLFERYAILDMLDSYQVIMSSAADSTIRLEDLFQTLELHNQGKRAAQITELRDREHQRLKSIKRKAVTF